MHKIFAYVLLITVLPSSLFAAERIPSQAESDPIHWSKDRVLDELASPWTTKARYYLYGGSATLATLLIFQDQLVNDTQKSVSTRKPLGHYSSIGDYGGQLIPNVLYAVGAYYFDKSDYAMMMIKSTMYSGLVASVLKFSIQEERPNHSNKTSFPSGHSSTAFAFASTVAQLHEWYYGAAAYAFASFVGFSRINDNMHYLHDVVAGATIGMVYGVGVTEINKKFLYSRNKKRESRNNYQEHNALNIAPIIDKDLIGLFARYEF